MTARWSTAGLRVGLTGAGGFIGQRVTGALAADGAHPIVVSGDVRRLLKLDEPVDVLCHLAGKAGPKFTGDPDDGVRVNVWGTLNALELCRRLRCRLVIASSCAVYRPVRGAVGEYASRAPADGYGFSKLLAEVLCERYAEHRDVRVSVLRLFNPYGPGQAEEFLIPYLCRAIADARPLRLRHPDSVRDFVHVQDVAEAIRRACLLDGALTLLNVGSGVPRRVVEVARMIADLMGRPFRWEPTDGAEDPYGSMWADVRAARASLGWHPQVSLETGLRMTLEASACGDERRS